MTKAELAVLVAKAAGESKASARRAVDAFTVTIALALRRGERVTLSGFGTFVALRTKARNGTHPRTGVRLRIPARRVARFRPSRVFKAEFR